MAFSSSLAFLSLAVTPALVTAPGTLGPVVLTFGEIDPVVVVFGEGLVDGMNTSSESSLPLASASA